MKNSCADLLLEIGTEELPPKSLLATIAALEKLIASELDELRLSYSGIQSYASPRRLSLIISELQAKQADTTLNKQGPTLDRAFDQQGVPTKAAEGFARGCGVSVEQLDQQDDRLCFSQTQPGKATTELLASIIDKAVTSLPVNKRMRWGSHNFEFSRPVHWLVLILGKDVVDANIFGIQSGRLTYGHRVHHPEPLTINHADDYVQLLHDRGKVMVDMQQRRQTIVQQVTLIASEHGAEAVIDDMLLDEITALVEWPVAFLGHFEEKFLSIPSECLISSMQAHQKYFHLVDDQQQLLPCFIAIANIESTQPETIIQGNERVIRPRLSDAEFFYQSDLKVSLITRREQLTRITFQDKLGSLFEKTERIKLIVKHLCLQLQRQELDHDAQRAAILCKSDLLSEMVLEFPELQGTMGSYYAINDAETDAVSKALYEQYLPRFANDKLPETDVGTLLSIADRIDTIAGIFGIKQPPTGSRDPFALRRHCIAIIRIIIDKQLNLDLLQLIDFAIDCQPQLLVEKPLLKSKIFDYFMDRLGIWLDELNIDVTTFRSVRALSISRPTDFYQRIEAVNQFLAIPEALSLVAAHKRVINILSKNDSLSDSTTSLQVIDQHLLQTAEEQQLTSAIAKINIDEFLTHQQYPVALRQLADLKEPVDHFFDNVMVMVDDEKLRNNRLLLLQHLNHLFSSVADLSELSVG